MKYYLSTCTISKALEFLKQRFMTLDHHGPHISKDPQENTKSPETKDLEAESPT